MQLRLDAYKEPRTPVLDLPETPGTFDYEYYLETLKDLFRTIGLHVDWESIIRAGIAIVPCNSWKTDVNTDPILISFLGVDPEIRVHPEVHPGPNHLGLEISSDFGMCPIS